MALLADPVCLGNLGEREGLRDREREAPGLDQVADLGRCLSPTRKSGGVISQFGLYKPWFYRQTFDPPSPPSISC